MSSWLLQTQMYFQVDHDFKLKYIHFFTPDIDPKKGYTISKEPPYHKKNDKHNLTKKSNFSHLNFEKFALLYFPLPYQLYENLYVNLQTKALINFDK